MAIDDLLDRARDARRRRNEAAGELAALVRALDGLAGVGMLDATQRRELGRLRERPRRRALCGSPRNDDADARTVEMVGRSRNEAGWPALLAGAAVAVWGWRVELALAALARSGVSGCSPGCRRRGCGGRPGGGAARRWCWRRAGAPARRGGLCARLGAAGVGACGGRRGLAVDALRVPRVLEVGGSGPVSGCGCASAAASRWRRSRRGARSWRRACACARSACSRERGDAAIARVTLVRRDPFDDAAPLPWPDARRGGAVAVGADPGRRRRARRARPGRAGRAQRAGRRRAGRRQVGRAVDAGRRRGARPGGAGVAARRQARRAGGVGAGRRAGRRPGRRARRSSCCARCSARWRRAIASCSPAGCARSAARTGCRCTWSSSTSSRSTSRCRTASSARSSPSCCATWSRAAARPA